MTEVDPGTLAHDYLDVQVKIDDLELRGKLIKDNLRQLLPYNPEGNRAWAYADAKVEWVKGRRAEKVDTAVLRTQLVLAGVDIAVLEAAFAKATTVSNGDPTLRVSAAKTEPIS